MRFRSLPVEIEAVQWTGDNRVEILEWCRAAKIKPTGDVLISTLEGDMIGRPGDWIIKGLRGEFYPCKPEIFAAKYEPVNDTKQEADSK